MTADLVHGHDVWVRARGEQLNLAPELSLGLALQSRRTELERDETIELRVTPDDDGAIAPVSDPGTRFEVSDRGPLELRRRFAGVLVRVDVLQRLDNPNGRPQLLEVVGR